MAIIISEDKRTEIRHTADIVEIISEKIILKKAGKDLIGLCPFHSEKTPSFTVSPSKQIYHCFGCGAGGDVFSFLMKYDGIGFFEAVSEVARRYGIDLPTQQMTLQQKKNLSEKQLFFDVNRQVMEFFRSQLKDPEAGEKPRAYLEKRGFRQQIIEEFKIGYVSDGWDNLIRFFKKSNIPLSIGEKIGLIVPKNHHGYYDRFRNRIIFPILDEKFQIIGFGGRVLDDSKPKYLNSPETPIYHKGHSLYGVHASKDKCREAGTVYIVEGYFDLIALHQYGFKNSVATLGTALTAEHVQILKRGFAQKAYLVFDSDEAGRKASHRGISLFINESVDAAVVVLPRGYDPDSYLHEFGAESFQQLSDQALSMIDFLLESAIQSHGVSVEGKIKILTDISEPLSNIADPVARSIYIRYVSERINVDEAVVVEKVKFDASRKKMIKQNQDGRKNRVGHVTPNGFQQDSVMTSDAIRLERQIVAMMLKSPSTVAGVEKSGVLNYFQDKTLASIGQKIISDSDENNNEIAGLMNRIDDDEQRRVIAALSISDESWDQKSCDNLLAQFLNSQKRKHNALLSRIKAAEDSDNQELLLKLLKEKQKLAAKQH